jgi:hypothetical protein
MSSIRARSSMDRAPDYGSGGWGFKSLRAHHRINNLHPLLAPSLGWLGFGHGCRNTVEWIEYRGAWGSLSLKSNRHAGSTSLKAWDPHAWERCRSPNCPGGSAAHGDVFGRWKCQHAIRDFEKARCECEALYPQDCFSLRSHSIGTCRTSYPIG